VSAGLEVRDLSKHFPVGRGVVRRSQVHAVDEVSFTLRPGTITALVGESGSGKSTVARLIARLYDPTSGQVIFDGRDVASEKRRSEILRYRSQVQMTFQDPFSSLNPVKTVRHHLARPMQVHNLVPRREIDAAIRDLLTTVGLVPPDKIAAKYPHELSGGQRQRVAIARALAVAPTVLVADEPISMLDVSIRIGILNLMLDLKQERNLAFLYVTHDLASARYVADEVLVMYAGQIVEHGPADRVLSEPQHPYTELLLSAVPDPDRVDTGIFEHRKGRSSAAIDPAPGCRFRDRCDLAIDVCSRVTPPLTQVRPDHAARCHVRAPSPALREDVDDQLLR